MATHHDHDHGHESFGASYVSPDPEYAVTPPGAGYEHTDANVWIIVKFALWLVISAAIIHVGVVVMFGLFVEQRESAAEPEFPLAVGTELRLPAHPRLQRFPANEALETRQRDAAALETYGWVDQAAGTVRIPITEAMRLTVERGLLPYRPPANPEAAPGAAADADPSPAPAEASTFIPADSSSGRTSERRRQ
jgi:hypothetical protein